MNFSKITGILALIFLAVGLSACATAPRATVNVGGVPPLTEDQSWQLGELLGFDQPRTDVKVGQIHQWPKERHESSRSGAWSMVSVKKLAKPTPLSFVDGRIHVVNTCAWVQLTASRGNDGLYHVCWTPSSMTAWTPLKGGFKLAPPTAPPAKAKAPAKVKTPAKKVEKKNLLKLEQGKKAPTTQQKAYGKTTPPTTKQEKKETPKKVSPPPSEEDFLAT